jgi:hypothetical protein
VLTTPVAAIPLVPTNRRELCPLVAQVRGG